MSKAKDIERKSGRGSGNVDDKFAPYIPTPEQIAESVALIQDTWSPQEKLRRELCSGPELGKYLIAPRRQGVRIPIIRRDFAVLSEQTYHGEGHNIVEDFESDIQEYAA